MTSKASTRRSFIRTTGAALSAPLATVGAILPPRRGVAVEPVATRMAMFEDTDAIRALNVAFARQVNAGAAEPLGIDPSVRDVVPFDFGDRDLIVIASDRQSAVAVICCTVQIETEIGPSCPLVEMARQQGGGVVRRSERGIFDNTFVRRDGVWSIERSSYRSLRNV